MTAELLALLPLWYGAFLLSLTCHEAAHAFVAWRGGDPTAYLGGQVSLNPLPHMQREPFGTMLVPLATFFLQQGGWMMGWASAPYDPYWEARHPRRAALMAAAGPAANLALALLAAGLLRFGMRAGWWFVSGESASLDALVAPAEEAPKAIEAVSRLLSIVFSLNVLLFLFNLIPVPPLDGASVLSGLVPAARRLRERFLTSGMGGLMGILLAWVIFARLAYPALEWAVNWLVWP